LFDCWSTYSFRKHPQQNDHQHKRSCRTSTPKERSFSSQDQKSQKCGGETVSRTGQLHLRVCYHWVSTTGSRSNTSSFSYNCISPRTLRSLSLSLSPSSPSLTLFLLFSVRHHHRHKNSSTCQTPVLGSLQTPSLANTSKTPRRPRRRRPGPRPEAVSVPDLSPARPTPLQPPLIFSQAMPTRLPLPSRLVPVSYRLSPTSPPSSPHTLSSHTSTSWKRTRSTDWFQHFSG
jgi:hypothetical protein